MVELPYRLCANPKNELESWADRVANVGHSRSVFSQLTTYYCVHLPQVLERNTIDHCVMPLAPLCIATQSFATFQAVLENMTLVTSISGVSVIP